MLTEICCIGRGLYGLLFHGELNRPGTYWKKLDLNCAINILFSRWTCTKSVTMSFGQLANAFYNCSQISWIWIWWASILGQGIKPRIGHNYHPSYPDIASCALFHYGISNLIMISPYLYNTVGHSFTLRHYRNSERDLSPEDVRYLLWMLVSHHLGLRARHCLVYSEETQDIALWDCSSCDNGAWDEKKV